MPTRYPLPPAELVADLHELARRLPRTDRVSVGFPGVVRDGRVVTTPGKAGRVFRRELNAGGREYWVAPPGTARPRIPRGVGTWPPG